METRFWGMSTVPGPLRIEGEEPGILTTNAVSIRGRFDEPTSVADTAGDFTQSSTRQAVLETSPAEAGEAFAVRTCTSRLNWGWAY